MAREKGWTPRGRNTPPRLFDPDTGEPLPENPTVRQSLEAPAAAMADEKMEMPELSPRPSHWPHWLGEKFSWANLLVFAVSESVGATLCIAAAEAFVHREWIAVCLGWGPGLPLVIFGLAFPFRGHLMHPETRERIQRR